MDEFRKVKALRFFMELNERLGVDKIVDENYTATRGYRIVFGVLTKTGAAVTALGWTDKEMTVEQRMINEYGDLNWVLVHPAVNPDRYLAHWREWDGVKGTTREGSSGG